jgi:acetylxylan esterase
MRATPVTLLAAAAGSAYAQKQECAKGLHLIVARGSDEDAGVGKIGAVADLVADRIDDSKIVALDYPATVDDPVYLDSVKAGAKQLRDDVRDYIKACPDSKLAVLGYSQGAQVAEDALCAGGADNFHNDPPLEKDLIDDNVIAIVLFGDPARQEDAKYNAGNATTQGIFDRKDISGCEAFSDRIISYCDAGDVYCDAGADETDRAIHSLYVERYGEDAADFVVDHWDDEDGDDKDDEDDKDDKDDDDNEDLLNGEEEQTYSILPVPFPSSTGSSSSSPTSTDSPSDDDDDDNNDDDDDLLDGEEEQTYSIQPVPFPSSTGTDSGSPTDTGSPTDDTEEGAATETGDAGDAAAGLAPSMGFLAVATLAMSAFGVLGLM